MGNRGMPGGDMLREKLLAARANAGAPLQPNTPPLMMGGPPEGLISGMVNRPEIGPPPVDIGRRRPPVELPPAPIPMPAPVPPPAPPVSPGLVSNIVSGGNARTGNTGITGGRVPGAMPTPMYESPSGGNINNAGPRKQKRNKAFTPPAQNRGMIF